VSGAKRYLLDVSTSSSFTTYLDGYHELDVGDVTGRLVTGLNQGATYYYRVRPYDAAGAGHYSDVMTATTVPTVRQFGYQQPKCGGYRGDDQPSHFVSRITLFTNPITIQIRLRYATTAPDRMPLPMGTLARTDIVLYRIPWSSYIGALRADATTSNDTQANASLPGAALSANVRPSSAGGRASGTEHGRQQCLQTVPLGRAGRMTRS
jgi:hypothetical protein